MNSGRKAAALVLVTAFAAGCRHKTQETPPPAAQAPIIPVSTLAKNAPPPQMPPPELLKVNPPSSTNTASAPKPKPKRLARRKPKTVEQAPTETATKDQNTEQASNGAGTDVSPIGQLSAAGEGINAPRHREIFDEINATEKGLNEIKRPLSQEEQTTASQIRTFLAKAKDALKQEDLDAANSLVTRAKVLLNELTKT
jgi:hypothetical protein